MDATDAAKLFDEDRQRFLTLFREFLCDRGVPRALLAEEAAATINAVQQIAVMSLIARG